jgi:hypothetical protein
MRGARRNDAPRIWGPDTPGVGARWGPLVSGAPRVLYAMDKAESVAHILWCAADTYPWSTKTWCVVDIGPMDKDFPSSATTSTRKRRCTETIFGTVSGCQGSYLGESLKVFAFTTHISDASRML